MIKEDKERKDIVSGKVMESKDLLRFTVTPDNQVIPDFRKRLPGKGIYVACSLSALKVAAAKNLFAKALKKNVKVSDGLIPMVEAILRKKGLEAVCLAKKAGDLVTGFEKVSEALRKDKAAFILEAKDAGADGHAKMLSLAKGVEVFALYDVEELDKALDRVNMVHAAFLKNRMSDMVYTEFKRLDKFLNS